MYEAQRNALQSSADAEKAQIQQNISNAGQTYQPVRNQAYIDQQLAEARRRESMANMGLSGAGGTSRTLQQQNDTTLLNTLGAADRAQQAYVDTQNQGLMDVNTAFSKALADIQLAESQALVSQSNWQQEYDAARQGEKNSLAYSLLNAGRINPAQFQQMTGISVSGNRATSPVTTEATKRNDYLYYMNLGIDSATAADLSGYTPSTMPVSVNKGIRPTEQRM
jgi:hypothetical protein